MKKLFILICLSFLLYPIVVSGQMATKQAGIRAGYRSGFFYQVSNDAGNAEIAYNALISFSFNGVQLTGLKIVYETPLYDISPDLYFAWGFGGHVGFVYTDYLRYLGESYYFQRDRFCPVIGADGWLALEYRVREIPLNVSLNLKPYVELTIPAFVKIMPVDFAVSVSYVF
jgi:hypothetical protein